jgi:hypothetical protein
MTKVKLNLMPSVVALSVLMLKVGMEVVSWRPFCIPSHEQAKPIKANCKLQAVSLSISLHRCQNNFFAMLQWNSAY